MRGNRAFECMDAAKVGGADAKACQMRREEGGMRLVTPVTRFVDLYRVR